MPRPKSSDKTGQRCIIGNAKFAANRVASNTRAKLFDINSIWIYDNLLGRHARLNKTISLDFSDHKDARSCGEIEPLGPLQQISEAQSPPMFRHPDFRPVVFKKQRAARTQTGFDSTPVESAIALIDKVRPLPFKLSACSAGKEHSVTQVESGTSQTERIRGDQLHRYFRVINARQTIIAYY